MSEKYKIYAEQLIEIIAEVVDCYTMSERELCERNGITAGEGKLISYMDVDEMYHVNNMAKDLELSKSRICRLVESLRKKKIISKIENTEDHRYNNIKLTELGTKIRDSFLHDRMGRCMNIITPIEEQKVQELIPLLGNLRSEFNRYKQDLKKEKQ